MHISIIITAGLPDRVQLLEVIDLKVKDKIKKMLIESIKKENYY